MLPVHDLTLYLDDLHGLDSDTSIASLQCMSNTDSCYVYEYPQHADHCIGRNGGLLKTAGYQDAIYLNNARSKQCTAPWYW
jgi:hypothetical protein